MAHTSRFFKDTSANRATKSAFGLSVDGWTERVAALSSTKEQGPLQKVLHEASLYLVYQPIVNLGDATIHAHEALIRGPRGSALHTPDALLRAAAHETLGFEFEYACLVATLRNWGQMDVPGRLFVNISAAILKQLITSQGADALLKLIGDLGILSRMLVLEITEHERVDDMDSLADVVAQVRSAVVPECRWRLTTLVMGDPACACGRS